MGEFIRVRDQKDRGPDNVRDNLSYLVRPVEQTERLSPVHPLPELIRRARAELVRLDPLLADDGRAHNAPVPVLGGFDQTMLGTDRVSKDVKQSSDVWPFFENCLMFRF